MESWTAWDGGWCLCSWHRGWNMVLSVICQARGMGQLHSGHWWNGLRSRGHGDRGQVKCPLRSCAWCMVCVSSFKNNLCLYYVLILCTTSKNGMWNLKFLFKGSFKFAVLKWCTFFCFLQYFALNLWCSGYNSLSLCRCVFTLSNSTLLPLHVQKSQFSWCFSLRDVDVSRARFLFSVAQIWSGRCVHSCYPCKYRECHLLFWQQSWCTG